MKEQLLQAVRTAGKPLAIEALLEPYEDKEAAQTAIKELLDEASLMMTRRHKLAIPAQLGLVPGRVQGHARGYGFFRPENGGEDAFLPADAMHGAMNGDTVWVRMTGERSHRDLPEAEVAIVRQRAKTEIVGTFEQNERMGGYVVPDDTRVSMDMLILRAHTKGAKAGDKVVASILEYPDGRRPMMGAITEVLGSKNAPGTDVLSIIRQYQLPEAFSKSAARQARQIGSEVAADEKVTREDLRGKLVFTIDGADAKDLDDAVSLEHLANGNLYLGVHIADVSHYVKAGSALDRDALQRGTSVYLADRVLPMLPVELSNGICSLHPGVDRLTLSCFMEVEPTGKVLRHRLSETIIRSKYRMVYGDVSKLLGGDEALRVQYAELTPVLEELQALALRRNERRVKRGSIDFDIAEAHIHVDDAGHATGIEREERGIANRIIEECMLLANETVAEHLYDLKSPFLYRVHEEPDSEKIREVNAFLQTLGYAIRNPQSLKPKSIQRVLDAVKGTKEENIVSKVVLRAMQKARYSEKCLGHFGLAAERYCHFTSPIRRYPDLMGHRIIKLLLYGGLTEKEVARLNEQLPGVADQCSQRERAAMEAERAVDDLKKCEYMQSRIGDAFDGVISGVLSIGFFVELGNTVEGLVRANTLDDDYYIYDEKNYRMVGRGHARAYRLGDTVRVRVTAVHMDNRTIDFELDMPENGGPQNKPQPGKPKRGDSSKRSSAPKRGDAPKQGDAPKRGDSPKRGLVKRNGRGRRGGRGQH